MSRFHDGNRVCFVGDSITHKNEYVSYVVKHYREKYPDEHIEFYNCGTSGGTLESMMQIFEEDVLVYNPTHIVLMSGVNDSARWVAENRNVDVYDALYNAYCRYQNNLDVFTQKLKDLNIELILCTPVPYDEYTPSDVKPLRGVSALMVAYALYVKEFAKKNGYPLCNFHDPITRKIQEEVLYNDDHVHPNSKGQYEMAKLFLSFQGETLTIEEGDFSGIEEWRTYVEKVRCVPAAEFAIIFNNFDLSIEERKEAMRKYVSDAEKGLPHVAVYKLYAEGYLENKDKIAENIQFLKDFMAKK